MNLLDKPYLLFYDVKELKNSLKVCVKHCPERTLTSISEIYNHYTSNRYGLCKYNFNYEELRNSSIDVNVLSNPYGPCPSLPIYERWDELFTCWMDLKKFIFSEPLLNRCIPKVVQEFSKGMFVSFSDLLNNWDTLEQILGDLYKTWHIILFLTLGSLGNMINKHFL